MYVKVTDDITLRMGTSIEAMNCTEVANAPTVAGQFADKDYSAGANILSSAKWSVTVDACIVPAAILSPQSIYARRVIYMENFTANVRPTVLTSQGCKKSSTPGEAIPLHYFGLGPCCLSFIISGSQN